MNCFQNEYCKCTGCSDWFTTTCKNGKLDRDLATCRQCGAKVAIATCSCTDPQAFVNMADMSLESGNMHSICASNLFDIITEQIADVDLPEQLQAKVALAVAKGLNRWAETL